MRYLFIILLLTGCVTSDPMANAPLDGCRVTKVNIELDADDINVYNTAHDKCGKLFYKQPCLVEFTISVADRSKHYDVKCGPKVK